MSSAGRLARFKLGKSRGDVDRALRYVVRSAYRNVSYYRKVWDEAGVAPGSIRRTEDLARLPVTTKEALLMSPGDGFLHRAADRARCVRTSTSGSTSFPLTIYVSQGEAYFRRASLVYAIGRNVTVRPPLTVVDVGTASWHKHKDLAQKLGMVRIVRIPRDAPLPGQVRILLDTKAPRYVQGRPSCLELLADELLRLGKEPPRPRLVVSFGEILYPHVRRKLARLFRCRVADYYNCEEVGNIAWECPAVPGRMHLNTDTCVLEVVGDRGRPLPPGEEGRILLTSLYNVTMPFVRYEIGDRGVLAGPSGESCPCGTRAPHLQVKPCREEDYLVLPNGSRVSPRVAVQAVLTAIRAPGLSNVLSHAIRRFQIVQEAEDRLRVRVLPGEDYTPDVEQEVRRAFSSIHPALRCEFEYVEELGPGPGGKHRKVLSHVGRRPGSEVS